MSPALTAIAFCYTVKDKGKKMDSVCYLCGRKLADTRDHIFPQNLFPRPLPPNLPTAPSCEECNNSLSDDEELFRTFVASGEAFETPPGYRIWTERVRPSLQQNRRGFKTLLRKLARELKLFSPKGIYLGTAMSLQIDQERVNRVLKKIARGLYYLDAGQPLSDHVCLLFQYAKDDWQKFVTPPLDEAFRGAERTDLGEGVLTYWRNIMKDDPANSITWLVFYGVHPFVILTYWEDVLRKTDL
jgi:hypothetical protein